MLEEEMLEIFRNEEISLKIQEKNFYDEAHNSNEDYYRLELKEFSGELYYVTQEKNSISNCVYKFYQKDKAVSFFTFFLLSKREIDRVRVIRNEFPQIGNSILSKEGINDILKKCNINLDTYDFINNPKVPVNFIRSENMNKIILYHNEKILSAIETENDIRAQLIFLKYVIMNKNFNDMIKSYIIKGILKSKINDEEYYMFFEPFEYLKGYKGW